MYSVARRFTGDEEAARDLVQETLLRAWRSFAPDDTRTYNRSWVFVIMRSAVLDWQRKVDRRIKMIAAPGGELTELAPMDLTEPFAPLPNMTEERFREFLDDTVVAALDALDPPFREVIVLSVAGGLGYRDIADVMDCPAGTVMSRLSRARRALREDLASYARQTGFLKESRS